MTFLDNGKIYSKAKEKVLKTNKIEVKSEPVDLGKFSLSIVIIIHR